MNEHKVNIQCLEILIKKFLSVYIKILCILQCVYTYVFHCRSRSKIEKYTTLFHILLYLHKNEIRRLFFSFKELLTNANIAEK